MAPKRDGQLRIYCLCGQKMKVSESMFGRPGKCVACRQKIRIPDKGEIPEGCAEIYLRDHPEFLRKPSYPPPDPGEIPEEVAGPDADSVEWSPPADFDIPNVMPLDVLPPLQALTSLDLKLERGLSALPDNAQGNNERATMRAVRERLANARARLDEQLGTRLVEVAGELASLGSKLVQLGVSVRTGDITFFEYRETSELLRRRREQLERTQHNVRGWLALKDPYTAGGYLNVAMDEVPDLSLPHVLPGSEEDARPLVEIQVGGIRDAFAAREAAEKRLKEAEKLDLPTSPGPQTAAAAAILSDCHAECEAGKRRADAEIAFLRQRLNQLAEDCSTDIKILQTCLERERARFNAGQLHKKRFRAVQSGLIGIQRDIARVHEMVTRALIASGASDVPRPEGTLLKRLPHPTTKVFEAKDWDAWIAWTSALIWGVSVFLPLSRGMSLLGLFREAVEAGHPLPYSNALPVLLGLVVTAVGALPRALWRGAALFGLWSAFTFGGLMLLHATQSSGMADAPRGIGAWLLRPAVAAMALADLAMLVAAAIGLLTAHGRKGRILVSAMLAVAVGLSILGLCRSSSPKSSQPTTGLPTLAAASSEPKPAIPELTPIEAPAGQVEDQEPSAASGSQEPPASSAKVEGGETVVQLRGLSDGAPDRPVRLLLRVQTPGRPQRDVEIALGGTVTGTWKAVEFNPQLRTVTVQDGEKIRILHVGQPTPLEEPAPTGRP